MTDIQDLIGSLNTALREHRITDEQVEYAAELMERDGYACDDDPDLLSDAALDLIHQAELDAERRRLPHGPRTRESIRMLNRIWTAAGLSLPEGADYLE